MGSWKIIVIMILFTICAAIVTLALIVNREINYYEKINNENRDTLINEYDITAETKTKPTLYEEYHIPVDDGTVGSKYGDTYFTNALNWEKVNYEDDKYFGYYYQISGLKNKEIERKVNDKLKNSALEYADLAYNELVEYDKKEKNDRNMYENYINHMKYINGEALRVYNGDKYNYTSGWKAYFDQCIAASFSNVICVATGAFSEEYPENYLSARTEDIYLNLDLNTGEEIHFEDLFCKDADIISSIRNTLYHKLPIRESFKYETRKVEYNPGEYYDESYNERYEEVDVIKLEKLIKKFKYTKELSFYFTNKDFGLHIDDMFFYIDYESLEGKIAIYNRFATKFSLFENENLSHELLCYKDYYGDNSVLYSGVDKNTDGIIYSFELYYPGYDGSKEKAKILELGINSLKNIIEKEKNILLSLKNNDEIIYCTKTFILEEKYSDFTQRNSFSGLSDYAERFIELTNLNRRLYFFSENSSTILKFSKEEFENGGVHNYYNKRYLCDLDWNRYGKEFEDYSNEHAVRYSDAKMNEWEKTINTNYSIERGQELINNKETLIYILNNGEEDLNEYLNLVCEVLKKRILSNDPNNQTPINDLNIDNLEIENDLIKYRYHSKKYNVNTYVTFSFLYEDYYIFNKLYKLYPILDYTGVT